MTGKLVQIIQGKEILCLNDGQGLGADGKRQTTHEEADRIVHIAMREHVAGKGDFYSVVSFCLLLSTPRPDRVTL